MRILKAKAVAALQTQFPSLTLSTENISVLHKGRFANAIVFRYRDKNLDVVIKDYSHCPAVIRQTIGRLFIKREHRNLQRLRGLPGVVENSCMLSPTMLAYPYVEGRSLAELRKEKEKLPVDFFQKMEELVHGMHERGVVHLDLRNMGNVLCSAEGEPHFIDFQSAFALRKPSGRIRRLLKAADLSAVYKSWAKLCTEPLTGEKRAFLENFNRIRRFWVLRGYPFAN